MKAAAWKYAFLLPVFTLGLLYLYRSADFPIHDFANYFFGGEFLRQGDFSPNVYFPYWFNRHIAAAGQSAIFAAYAPNTPFVALMFGPFSLLPVSVAKFAFNAISLLLFVFSLQRISSHYKIDPVWIAAIPIVFFLPIKNQILFGQLYFPLFFLLAECWLAYEKGRMKTAAFFLSVAILLKVFPVMLLLLFVFRKQFRLCGLVALSIALLTAFTAIFTGYDVWQFYLADVLPKAGNGEISTAFADNYQSAFMFFKRLLVYDKIENPGAFLDCPVLFKSLLLSLKVAIVTAGFYISRKPVAPLNVLSYWILAMVVLSPYGSTYTFVMLIFPFLAIASGKLSMTHKALVVSLLTLLCNFPLSLVDAWPFPLSYARFLLLMVFLLAMLSTVRRSFNLKWVSGLTLVSLVLCAGFAKNQIEKSKPFSNQALPILVYDYEIGRDSTTYFYFGQNGFSRSALAGGNRGGKTVQLEMRCNEIYLNGRAVSTDNGHKLKPVLYGRGIVYLSDYGRGTGFYTLRKIELNDRE